jgi:hypothetical protein
MISWAWHRYIVPNASGQRTTLHTTAADGGWIAIAADDLLARITLADGSVLETALGDLIR